MFSELFPKLIGNNCRQGMEWEVGEDLAASQGLTVCWRPRQSGWAQGGGREGPPHVSLCLGGEGDKKKHAEVLGALV